MPRLWFVFCPRGVECGTCTFFRRSLYCGDEFNNTPHQPQHIHPFCHYFYLDQHSRGNKQQHTHFLRPSGYVIGSQAEG
ncbi:hypothetical protein AG0111_0g7159 [Alternaria gaisen]|uniref:Uncharacterized protein n=1 Tax=Alternaria gaisen TaxID=167740 RepID=A0ACB6FJW5_9PLEO|nr:hypothetical protein AG0111_0g7159 [Alternaria gaisen]